MGSKLLKGVAVRGTQSCEVHDAAEVDRLNKEINKGDDLSNCLPFARRRLYFPLTLKEFKNFSKDLIEKAVQDASQNRMKLEASPRPVSPEKSGEVLQTIIEGAYQGTIDKIVKL
jgi:hypothetical protein